MDRIVKTMLAISISGLLGTWAGGPLLAEAGGIEMPWPAQFGLCGLFGGLLWWAIAKTIPQVSKDNKDAVIAAAEVHATALGELGKKVDEARASTDGVRTEIKAGNDSQLGMLRQLVMQGKATNQP